jgi:F-type H+-transporting ATPase subunit delta
VQLASLLVGTGQVALLPKIADALVKRASSEKQLEVAEVRTAISLTDAQQQRIADALTKATGKRVNLKVVVDPSVIGGVVATVGDEVIDDTVRTRLDQVKSRL